MHKQALLPSLLLGLLCLAATATAQPEVRHVETDDGTEIPIEVHAASGDTRVLWWPSEFGRRPREREVAAGLVARGIEVWMPDFHAAWFLPEGRYSLNDIQPGVFRQLLQEALGADDKTLYLMGAGRVVGSSLYGVHAWQSHSAMTHRLGGYLMIGPRFFVRTPEGGEKAEYLPIVSASNIPSYILQPGNSGAIWRVRDDIAELEKGGAAVYLERLDDVGQGFHARAEYSAAEARMSQRLPGILERAIRMLALQGGTPARAPVFEGDPVLPERRGGSSLLQAFAGDKPAPALRLPTLRGIPVDLAGLGGKVVLVNFWATWCPPCVEEIPSLQRLYAMTKSRGLEILAVDVGETAAEMEAFLQDKPIDFPVLMDTDGKALRAWGVYAFPTTLVLDRQHRIRYAVFGAFDWSGPEVLKTLEPLLQGSPGG